MPAPSASSARRANETLAALPPNHLGPAGRRIMRKQAQDDALGIIAAIKAVPAERRMDAFAVAVAAFAQSNGLPDSDARS